MAAGRAHHGAETERIVGATFAVVLGVLTLTALVAFLTVRAAFDSGHWVEHTLAVEKQLANLSSALATVDVTRLELVLTDDPDTTHRLEADRLAVMRQVQQLQELTRDNASQRDRIIRLRRAVDDDFAPGARTPATRSAVVRDLIAEMTNAEELLLRERTARADANAARANGLGGALGVFAVLALAVGYVLIRRETRSRQVAVDAFQQSEVRFSRLTESGLIGIAVATLDRRIIEINDTLLGVIGYTREEILSGAVVWRSLTPPEWNDRDDRAIDDMRSSRVMALREKEYVHKNGTRVPVLIGAALLPGADRFISFVLDLTHNRQAALAIEHLREVRVSEAKFRSLLEGAPDAVVIFDSHDQIVLVNSQTERLFGYSRAELIGMHVEILKPERQRVRYPKPDASSPSGAGARPLGAPFEVVGLRKDGSEFPSEVSLNPLDTEGGKLYSIAVRDITERRKSEEQRFRLAAIVESSGDAMIGKTLDGVITSWNEGAHRTFGYTSDEAIGRSLSLILPPGREGEEREILHKLARGERIEQFDTVRRRKDGLDIDVSVTSAPVRDAGGNVVGAAKVVRDITRRKKAEEALAHAKDVAEAATHELEAFSYSVAHDLRAPLRGMNGFAQLLLDTYQDKLDAEGQDWLREILLNAKKMGELIDGLLSLARLTRSELHLERTDLSVLVHEAAAPLAAAASDRNVELVVQEGLSATVDVRLARSLFANLIGNAWKFTGKVGAARIELGATERDGATTFFIKDNGAGFDMAFAAKMFAPFQRLHSVDEFPGTGIGLAIVQRIVQRHGGRIWAEGAVNGGATFFFTFPNGATA